MPSTSSTSEANASAWQSLCTAVEMAWPSNRWANVGVVVGCSGGADSMALAAVLRELSSRADRRGFVTLAHFNHGLRGADSDADEAFVREMARLWDVDFVSAKQGELADIDADPDRSRQDTPTEQFAAEAPMRQSRLSFLQRTAETVGARYVALAHHEDDQVETVLHHFMRGTGPTGLTGIPLHRPLGEDVVLIRPLLGVSRETIRKALEEQGIGWREDSSNQTEAYTRNWIRGVLLPTMRQRFPQVNQAILRARDSVDSWRELVDNLASNWKEKAVKIQSVGATETESEVITVCIGGSVEPAIVIRGLQMAWDKVGWPRGAMTSRHWNELADLIVLESSKKASFDPVCQNLDVAKDQGCASDPNQTGHGEMLPHGVRVLLTSGSLVLRKG